MAELVRFKQLNAVDLTTTSATRVYTLGDASFGSSATADEVQINSIRICNRGTTSETITVWGREGSTSTGNAYLLEYQHVVGPKQSIEVIVNKKITFATANSSITVQASLANVLNVSIYGMEIYT